jgi:serine/threonine protein kinase
LGTLMFDMLTGCPPFSAESKRETQYKVLHDQIKLPAYLSPHAKDLLKNLLKRNHASRLGAGERDAEEIKEHSWFGAIDWELLLRRELAPLYLPPLKGPEDVSQFDPRFTKASIQDSPSSTPLNGGDVFQGFTFTEESSIYPIQENGANGENCREFLSEIDRRRLLTRT